MPVGQNHEMSVKQGFLYVLLITCTFYFLYMALDEHQHRQQFGMRKVSDLDTPSQQQQFLWVWQLKNIKDNDQLQQLNNMAEYSGEPAAPSSLIDELILAKEKAMKEEARPLYMNAGTKRPQPVARSQEAGLRIAPLWPHEDPNSDSIINQLIFVPLSEYVGEQSRHLKKILVYNGLLSWYPPKSGMDEFVESRCPVDTCTITYNKSEAVDADVILYQHAFVEPKLPHPLSQVWVLCNYECPNFKPHIKFKNVFNWTGTYQQDCDIVNVCVRWVYYNKQVKQNLYVDHNYAANKTKKVAWFVSNCMARNKRLQNAQELPRYIPVDIYGKCRKTKCPCTIPAKCFDMLDRDYKFYLAFETSNCKDYITEKLYVNSFRHIILPVVMGARLEDYARVAPHCYYIHVDEFESPKELATYLHRLDREDDLYNLYFH